MLSWGKSGPLSAPRGSLKCFIVTPSSQLTSCAFILPLSAFLMLRIYDMSPVLLLSCLHCFQSKYSSIVSNRILHNGTEESGRGIFFFLLREAVDKWTPPPPSKLAPRRYCTWMEKDGVERTRVSQGRGKHAHRRGLCSMGVLDSSESKSCPDVQGDH